MTSSPVLVFGPTGAVGRAAALEAGKRNAKVWLAMRYPSKTIEGLDEKADNFTRVQADLSKPDTLRSAVEQSGAKAAFVYTLEHSIDAMKASFEALKAAGITYIVLLGSFKVVGEASDVTNLQTEDVVRKVHAAAEIALKEVGVEYVTLRPAFFNSNIRWYTEGIKAGAVDVLFPDVVFDYIAPEDIGTAAGTLLVEQPSIADPTKALPMNGPQLMSQHEAFGVVGKALGREIEVREMEEEKFIENSTHMPRDVVEGLVKSFKDVRPPKPSGYEGVHGEAVENLRRYKGSEPMRLEEWVRVHKGEFL